ncbi:golgin subfamily A member 6-like protein 6 [Adelges cooleyi]|uniref:golgin subfamily A member 6-like protein 6 n=1 Tax=Adelges cooleyi TaxID=133065 RepID=UPI002180237C|nr:golgin subfamily A member 6-like protein 6 [Adelges cooleyi]
MHSSLEPNKRGPILKKDKQLSEYPEFVKGYQKKLSLLLKSGKLNAADQKMLEHLFEKELAGSPEFSKEYQRMVNNLQKYGKLSPADQKKWEKHLEKKLDNSSEFVKEYQSMANHMQKYGKLSPADEKIWGHIFKDDSTDSGIGKKGLNQAKSIQNLENENIQKEDLLKKRTEAILNVKKETFLKSEKKRKKEEEKLRKLKAREEIIKKNAEKVMQSEERKRLREEELKNRRRDDKKNEDAKRTEIMRIKEHEERVKLKETNEKIRKLEDLEKEAKRILQEEQQWREKINREFAMKMRYTNDPNNCILAIIPNLVNNEDDYKIGKKGKDRFIQYTKRQLEKIKKRDKIFDYGNLMKEIIQRELGNTQNNHPKLYENEKLCNNQSLDPYRKTAMIDNTTSRWIQNKNVVFKSCCPLNNLADFNELYIQNGLVSHKHCSL